MANLVASALSAAQAKIMPGFVTAEMRERQNPILRKGLENQKYLMVDVNSIKESTKRAVKGYQRVKTASTGGTTRTHNFTGSQPDTVEVNLSWTTISEKFSVWWDSGADNIFSTQETITHSLKEAMRNMRERSGTGLVTSLHAARTQTSNAVVRNATFNAANDAFEISGDKRFFSKMKSVMSQHKYYGPLDVIVDSMLDVEAQDVAAQGTGNGENKSYQMNNLTIMPHDILGTEVAVSAYPDGGVAIALPANSFSFIPWIPAKYKEGKGDAGEFNGKRFVIPDDTGLDISYAVWAYSEKADGSAVGGTTDDMVTHFQISYDVNTQISEISAADETSIYEYAMV